MWFSRVFHEPSNLGPSSHPSTSSVMAVAVASPSTSSVMLPERYQMYQFNNEVFYLVFSGNRVYQTRSRAAGAPRTIVSRQYLEQDWICQNLVWTVVPREIPTRIAALYDLALDFLPYWNDVVWLVSPRHVRKYWSHHGATQRYGDCIACIFFHQDSNISDHRAETRRGWWRAVKIPRRSGGIHRT